MKFRKWSTGLLSLLSACSLLAIDIPASAAGKMDVTINMKGERKAISPYIYGINDGCNATEVSATSIRQGGNRYSGYNWETNYSNAGSDWKHSSDTFLSKSTTPAATATQLLQTAQENQIPYKIATLQMCGYVSADKNGAVTEAQIAPSSRWNEVVFRKNSSFSMTPDLTDGYVYMDEYVNYLVNTLGSSSQGGINGYSLDNEPALWAETHGRMHPEKVTCSELITKSTALASAVKDVDPDAEIFGPALYGHGAFVNLQSASDWNSVKGNYGWFIDYYLDQMSTAELLENRRLLDVLDLHYYSEAKGTCRVTNCTDELNHTDCMTARMNAPRTLYEEGYVEKSWIGQWNKEYLPYLKKLNESIDSYYPETKLSFTEYNFGGGKHISGAIAEADALGAFATNGVYLATVWPLSDMPYIYSAIDLYTNYDGKGNSFGDTLVESSVDNLDAGYVYASIDGNDENTLKAVVSNKSLTSEQEVSLSIEGASVAYKTADIYLLTENSSEIKFYKTITVNDDICNIKLPAMSVAQVVFSTEDIDWNKGDANFDTIIDSDDSAEVLRIYTDLMLGNDMYYPEEQLKICDVSGDGVVDSDDAVLILKYYTRYMMEENESWDNL